MCKTEINSNDNACSGIRALFSRVSQLAFPMFSDLCQIHVCLNFTTDCSKTIYVIVDFYYLVNA